jgi:hypothetical protein
MEFGLAPTRRKPPVVCDVRGTWSVRGLRRCEVPMRSNWLRSSHPMTRFAIYHCNHLDILPTLPSSPRWMMQGQRLHH